MKVTRKGTTPTFNPFRIEVMIESVDEMSDLLARMSCTPMDINKNMRLSNNVWRSDADSSIELWNLLLAEWNRIHG